MCRDNIEICCCKLTDYGCIIISRSKDFYELLLDWKQDGFCLDFDQCFFLNFGYHNDQLSIPQLSLTPDSITNLNFDSASSCIFVIIGGKYLDMIGDVMEKVNSVTNDVGGIRPLAVFIMSKNNYKENVNINVDYGFDRYKSTPVMVK